MFVLIDRARIDQEIEEENFKNGQSMYLGRTGENLAAFSPYLFTFEKGSSIYHQFSTLGWGNSWGILFSSNSKFELLFSHFRKFLMVKTEEGKQLYFRFYDPRVLRIFLPTCDKAQLIEFFGPVQSFVCEDEDPAFALKFFLQNGELKTERLPAASLFGSSAEINTQAVVSNVISQPQAKETPKTGKNLWMD